MTEDWPALGRLVKERRKELRLGQGDLGPSDLTIRKLEQGIGKDLRRQTLTQIEQALLWREGTCVKLLTGTATAADTATCQRDDAAVSGEYLLGPEIVRRRKRLRLSQADLAAEAGLNVATIRRLETERTESMRGSTAGCLESALQWRTGLVDRLIDGTAIDEELEEIAERSAPAAGPAAVLAANLIGHLVQDTARTPAADAALRALHAWLPELYDQTPA